MIRRPPRSTLSSSSAASDVYKRQTMHFTGGGSCWQGPSRSAKVHLGCGRENKILTVDEPERCTYVLDMSTPAACTTEQLGRLEAQLKELSGPEALKDEM
eukprot:TRINITY_DN7786_c0_g1_i4.p1 TRINITY_DN7786_c0_g1~~TRINITY_DN7786_c0_g1_i4.p1  ORF type:complete len:100 (-),score=34.46 TRINITY_DN7786_c0_g1_i4:445-744(-)